MNLEKLRSICLGFPGAEEDVKWGADLCFIVKSKMFCVTGMANNDPVSFKASEEEFELLTEREDILPAPYLARNKWVAVQQRNALKPKEWEYYLRCSYDLVVNKLPKKLQQELKK